MCQHTGGSANSGPQALWQAPPPTQGKQETSPQHQGCENPGQMWDGFGAATNFYIIKKKCPVHVEMTRSAFPLAAHSRAHGSVQVLNGSAKLINLLGQQMPLPCGLALLSPQTKMWVQFSRQEAGGAAPQKKEDTFVVGYSLCFNQREYKLLCALLLKKQTNKQTHAISQGGLF